MHGSVDANENAIKCLHPRCRYRGTFNRVYDLNRHMKKHTNASAYKCVVINCDRGFYRQDKLTQHIQVDHGLDELAACPVSDCGFNCLELALLRIHVSSHQQAEIRYLRWRDYREDHCPINGCKQLVYFREMQEHFKEHKASDLRQSRDALTKAGYDNTSFGVVCPICQEKYTDSWAFEDHLVAHLVTNLEHYSSIFRQLDRGMHRYPWESWYSPWTGRCQVCDEVMDHEHQHHKTLLADPDDIIPYRLAILKLLPDFYKHPVFDDIRLSPDKRASKDDEW